MFQTREAIHDMGEILFGVCRSFSGWCEPQFARGLHQPLPLLPRSHLVRFDVRRAELVAIAPQGAQRVVIGCEVRRTEHAWSRGQETRAWHLVCLDDVGKSEDIGRDLWVAHGGDAHRQIGETVSRLRLQEFPRRLPVRVKIDKPGDDVLSAHINDLRTRRNRDRPSRPNASDASIGHDEIGVVEDFITAHGHDGSALQYHGAARCGARE